MEFSAAQIAALVQGELEGDSNIKVNNLAKIEEGAPGCISFLANMKYESFVYTTKSSIVLIAKSFVPKQTIHATLIKVEDPYLSFTILLQEYQRLTSLSKSGTEEPVYTGSNTQIGENFYRGAFSYVGQNCVIGTNVKIYPHVYVGDGVTIGNNTIL